MLLFAGFKNKFFPPFTKLYGTYIRYAAPSGTFLTV